MAEPVSALGEVSEESSSGIESATCLRRSANCMGAGAGLCAGQPGAGGRAEETAAVSGSVSAGEDDRAEAGEDLRDGESAAQSEDATGSASEQGGTKTTTNAQPAERLWKSRSVEKSQTRLFHRAWKSRKERAIPTFPQPRRRRVSGYISNVSTAHPRVTFLNVLTRVNRHG